MSTAPKEGTPTERDEFTLDLLLFFLRAQRMRGVSTILWSSARGDDWADSLARQLTEWGFLRGDRHEDVKRLLQQEVIDTRDLMTDALVRRCNRDG